MAKKQRTNQVTASFHYFLKRQKGQPDSDEVGLSGADFQRLVNRMRDITPIDFDDEREIRRIKVGENIPLLRVTQLTENRFFGQFEGAYYGQEYRNTRLGVIDAESLNLRKFHYIVDFRRDGKVVLGVQYIGNFGDYDGIRSCFLKILQDESSIVLPKSITSIRNEIGDGEPVELKVSLRRQNPIAGGGSIFSRSGVYAVKRSNYGDDFDRDIREGLINRVRGGVDARRSAIAQVMSQGDFMEVNEEDIQDCTVLVRKDNHQYTVYLLGDNNISTKFPLNVQVPPNGLLDYDRVQAEMVRILDDVITPGLRQ